MCNFDKTNKQIQNHTLSNFDPQYTEDDHEDKPNLQKAISTMTDVATAINEFKRRKDLGK